MNASNEAAAPPTEAAHRLHRHPARMAGSIACCRRAASLCPAGAARPADRHLAAAVCRAGGRSRSPLPPSRLSAHAPVRASAPSRCAAPAAPATTSSIATSTRRSTRTAGRPLPSGAVTPRQALVFLALQLAVGLVDPAAPSTGRDQARALAVAADRHLSVHEAHHLVAAGFSSASPSTGARSWAGRLRPAARSAGQPSSSMPAASPGRCSTTRSMRTRTRRTMR